MLDSFLPSAPELGRKNVKSMFVIKYVESVTRGDVEGTVRTHSTHICLRSVEIPVGWA